MINRHSPDNRICVHEYTMGQYELTAIAVGRDMARNGYPEPDGETYASAWALDGYREVRDEMESD